MKNNTIPKCGIYKYVYHNEVIYIGKSDSSILERLLSHETEEKFQPYLDDCEIYYFQCDNPAETTIFETALINRYHPILNIAMKYNNTQDFDIKEKEWIMFQKDNVLDLSLLMPHEQRRSLMSLKKNIINPFLDKSFSENEIISFISDEAMPYIVIMNEKHFKLVFNCQPSENKYICRTKWSYIRTFIEYWQQEWLKDSDELHELHYLIQEKIMKAYTELSEVEKMLKEQLITIH